MATGQLTNDLCDLCKVIPKAVQAVKWCPECEEKLCVDCHTRHAASKLLKLHKVIEIEHYRQLPKSTLEVKSFCSQHEMKYTSLCAQHDQLCCPACLSKSGTHGKCTESLLLADIVKTVKTSTLFELVESNLNNLTENLQLITESQNTNIQELLDQKNKIKETITTFRETITKHLNNIEEKVLEELNKKVAEIKVQIETQKTKLKQKLEKVKREKQELNAVKQYGSDLQAYVTCKGVEKDVTNEIKSISGLVSSGNLKKMTIELVEIGTITDKILNLSSFGSVKEETTSLPIVLKPFDENQAQIMATTQHTSFDDIELKFNSKINIKSTHSFYIRGCVTLDINEVILAENCARSIKKLTENGIFNQVVSVSSGPWDVTVIDRNTVAVSTDEGMQVINIRTNTVGKTINTGRCHGLEYYKGSLFCCIPEKGVLSVDLTNYNITTVVHDKADRGWYYCTVYNDRIYTTRSEFQTVSCYTIGGNKVWEFKDQSVIKHPFGIVVDNSSNVYIASYSNHSIVVLSPDGQRYRTLLTRGEINFPIGLHLDQQKQQLMVANCNGPVCVFNL